MGIPGQCERAVAVEVVEGEHVVGSGRRLLCVIVGRFQQKSTVKAEHRVIDSGLSVPL